MNPEQTKAVRVNVLQNCIDELTGAFLSKKGNYRKALETTRQNLNEYPDFEPLGEMQRADRLAVLAISKINMGLLADLPPKVAINEAYGYLCEALSVLVDKK